MKINETTFGVRAALALGALAVPCAAAAEDAARDRAAPAPERPDILMILVDDMGYGDMTLFRGDSPWTNIAPVPEDVRPPETPHLDAMAERGMMLTDFYANSAICSPTRAALMTGRYQQRSGVVSVLGQLGGAFRRVAEPEEEVFEGLRRDELTMADVLHDAGYRTAMFGKWHLGGSQNDFGDYHPMDYGFEKYVGSPSWAGDNFSMRNEDGSYFFRDRERVDAPGNWYTDVLADEAAEYLVDRSDGRPAFVYLSFTAPHLPLIGPDDKEIANAWDYSNRFGPREDLHRAYKEIIEGLDAAIGRLWAQLEEAGVAENTLVFFASDNGPVDYGSAEPLRGRKTWLYEGGTRSPTFALWPAGIQADSRTDEPTMTMDLLPTFAMIAGAEVPEDRRLDGIDLSPLLRGETRCLERRLLFWEQPIGVHIRSFTNRRWAVRDGDWKLLKERDGAPLELYNLDGDPREYKNVAEIYPHIVERLEKAYWQWREDVYADAPYDEAEFVERLKQHGLMEYEGLFGD
ncbi:MAG: sulfatase-like hydrolase/transferase [Opitutales bacterium]|nr:sulfatase-like hydrolase/transferase [Opitutales bacterium]